MGLKVQNSMYAACFPMFPTQTSHAALHRDAQTAHLNLIAKIVGNIYRALTALDGKHLT